MKNYLLTEEQIIALFNAAAEHYELYVPVNSENGQVFCWEKTARLDKMVPSNIQPTASIKKFFFPNSEPMFGFKKEKQEIELYQAAASVPRLVLGVHSCDLGSIKVLEALFKDTVDDELFREKRQNTVLVGISCSAKDWACFCSQLEINSRFSQDGDLFITPREEKYILSVTSAKGEDYVNKYLENGETVAGFTPANDLGEEETFTLDFPKIKEVMDSGFELPVWEKFARKCINCGICTFLCPTCHCFDVFDEARRERGARFRCYDSCMFPEFTRMAGGYNPRSAKAARLRQRYLHKYKYFVDNFNLIACSGCGRCIRHCPVNVDVRQNLNILQHSGSEGEDD